MNAPRKQTVRQTARYPRLFRRMGDVWRTVDVWHN